MDIFIVEEVKFRVDRSNAGDDTMVFWNMDRCIARIEAGEVVYRGSIYSQLGEAFR